MKSWWLAWVLAVVTAAMSHGAELEAAWHGVGRSYWPQQSDAVVADGTAYVVYGDDTGVSLFKKQLASGESSSTLIRANNSSAFSRVAVAVDGSTLVVAYADESQLTIYRSTDGGATFTEALVDTFFRNLSEVKLYRFGSSFHLFAVSGAVMTRRSDDGGATWTDRRSIDPGGDVALKAAYGVNDAGIHIVYLNRGARLVYLNTTNGVNWYTSLTGQVNEDAAPAAVTSFDVAAFGGTALRFNPTADGLGFDIHAVSRTGGTWLSTVTYDSAVGSAAIFPLPNGEWCLFDAPYIEGAYRGRYRTSSDGGLTWSIPSLMDLDYDSDRWCSHCATPLAPELVRATHDGGHTALLWFMNNFYPGNYTVRLQELRDTSGPAVAWVGHTRHWPGDGAIRATSDLWINTESWPVGAGQSAIVVWSTNRVHWNATALRKAGLEGNNDWWHANLGAFPAGSTVDYAVAVIDASGRYVWDSRGGQNYRAVVEAAQAVRWCGNVHQWPYDGELDPGESLWINTESWPKGAGLSAVVRFSTSTGDEASWVWSSFAMNKAGVNGNNDWWNRNLGSFPAGTEIKYVSGVTDGNGTTVWNDNGSYRTTRVRAPVLQWAGNQHHWPVQGQIDATDDFWVNIESWPKGAATGGIVVYTTDGTTWRAADLKANGATAANDKWHANLGSFPSRSVIRYAIMVRDGNGNEKWDSNNGQDYRATVN